MQRLSPSGGCGGPWRSGATEARRRARRRQDGGRDGGRDEGGDVRAKEGATKGSVTVACRRPQWRSDSGATEAASRAGRWLPPFRLLFGGGARPATQTSWMEAQSAMEMSLTEVADGDGEVAREKMMNSEGSRDWEHK